MRTFRAAALAAAGCAALVGAAAHAQGSTPASSINAINEDACRDYNPTDDGLDVGFYLYCRKGSADAFKLDMDFPASPAHAVLGLDPAPLTNVQSFNDLGVQVLSGFDENGTLNAPGLSFGGLPYWWGERDQNLFDYKNGDPWMRRWARTHFSVATINEAGEDGEDDVWKAGLALTTEWFDDQDPRLNVALNDCLADAFNKVAGPVFDSVNAVATHRAIVEVIEEFGLTESDYLDNGETKETSALIVRALMRDANGGAPAVNRFQALLDGYKDEEIAKVQTDNVDAAYDACQNAVRDDLLTKPSLRLGVGQALISETGKADDFAADALSVWVSGRRPIPMVISNGQLSGLLQYDTQRTFETSDGDEAEGDRLLASVALSVVSDNLTLSGSIGYVELEFADAARPDDSYSLFSLTASRRMRQGVWLELGVGSSDSDALEDEQYANVRLKMDWNQLGANR